MNKYLFIKNPISGGQRSKSFQRKVESIVGGISSATIVNTEYPGHARELASTAIKDGFDAVVAVGGDGTVNEVASALVGTDTALGVVPIGSGNGLARHLGIPLQPEKAISAILNPKTVRIDSATINGTPFFCTSGVGFDAQVAADYAKAEGRGLITYAKEAVRDWFSNKPGEYVIETEEGTIQTKALLITVGNANQWGNDYFITPRASLFDGKLDIAIVQPASVASNLKMVWQLRHKTLYRNNDVVYLKSSFVRIELLSGESAPAHFDGEAALMGNKVLVKSEPSSLNVLI